MFVWLLMFVVGGALYFLPSIIAVMQHRVNMPVIIVINVLLGWSIVGWIVALVMALTRDVQSMQVVQVQQHVGYPPQMGYGPPQGQYGQQGYYHPGPQQVAPTYEHPIQQVPGTDIRQVQQPQPQQRPLE